VDLTVALAAPAARLCGLVLAAVALGLAVWRAPWWWLRKPGSVHVLGGATVILLALWQLRAGIGLGQRKPEDHQRRQQQHTGPQREKAVLGAVGVLELECRALRAPLIGHGDS
jgi:hypothetical protein